jgi:hypothetical protein
VKYSVENSGEAERRAHPKHKPNQQHAPSGHAPLYQIGKTTIVGGAWNFGANLKRASTAVAMVGNNQLHLSDK